MSLHKEWTLPAELKLYPLCVSSSVCGLNHFESKLMNTNLAAPKSTLLSTGVSLMRNIAGLGCSLPALQYSQMTWDTKQETRERVLEQE